MKTTSSLLLLAAACVAPTQAGLVAHYKFDEGSGTVIGDSSGNGRDLTLYSGTWNTSGQFGGSVTLGGALARSGGSSSATITSLNTVTGSDITVAFWANVNSESIGSNPFTISDSNNSAGNRIASAHLEWSDGTTYWDAQWANSTANRVSGDIGNVSSARHHYIFTYDSSNGDMEVFKDNVSILSGSAGPGGAIDWGAIQNFELGAASFVNGSWGGEMDDFAIWDEVIDSSTRNTIFTSGVSAVPEPSSTALLGLGGLALILRRRK